MTARGEADPAEIGEAAADSPSLAPGDSLEAALRVFDACGRDRLAVCKAGDANRLAGWVTHVAVLRRCNAALTAVADEEHQR
jgi:CIC family chloride channel protein